MSDLEMQAARVSPARNELENASARSTALLQGWAVKLAVLMGMVAVFTGCQTDRYKFDNSLVGMDTNAPVHSETIVLREGDSVKISFPTSPNLDSSSVIRRDGKISAKLVGDVTAAGKTLAQLRTDLQALYKDQTDTKDMAVELVNSVFPVFVTGAVLQPHKVMSDHPITALETIMECGGFDYSRANLKSVTVLRWEGTHLQTYHLNLKKVMQGKDSEQFYMKPADIIYVKEKFTWF